MENQLFSIILPVYNQAEYIKLIIEQYIDALRKFPSPYEILLIVNGSKDDTLEVCNNLSDKYRNIKVFSLENRGWGRAVKTGLKEAKGDIICFTNSARTPAKDLVVFLIYSLVNSDVVIKANRKIRDSKIRRIGSLLYNLECRVLFDLANWDINGTPKIFPRKFKELLNLKKDDDLIDLEFNYICKKENYPMIEIPVFFSKRQGGKSTTNYRSAINMYLGAWKFIKSIKTENFK